MHYRLTPNGLSDAVRKNSVVLFHASYCGYCTQFAPTYESFAQKMRDRKILVTSIEMKKHGQTVRAEDVLGQTFGGGASVDTIVRGYPTLLFFKKGHHAPIPYKGPRTVEGLMNAVDQIYA